MAGVAIPPHLAETFDQFVRQPGEVRNAISGIDPGTLNRRPIGSDWSIRDYILLFADSEQWFATALRLALTAEDAALPPIDEAAFLRKLHYLWRDPEAALSLFQQARWANAELLERLDPPHWSREVTIAGQPSPVSTLFQSHTTTAQTHLEQLRAALRA